MQKRTVTTIQRSWLFLNVSLLLLPLYYAIQGDSAAYLDSMEVLSTAMVLLSFPFCLFGAPIIAFFLAIFEMQQVDKHLIQYYALLLLFMFGCVQWFWAFPRYMESGEEIQKLNLPDGQAAFALRELQQGWGTTADARSPFERVMREYEKL